ncbi:hypothetical protein CVIRNUC_004721 [Coccomyxa viridis]|uniref:Uncharacterized protein n=1 Tax=Coccomyxa viridis TaxID=1274662 RepID=A0AAV1I2E2_9CHLO|nr:hypothetical protein CVIRNUC_004721 [Coccomyxa viridis]
MLVSAQQALLKPPHVRGRPAPSVLAVGGASYSERSDRVPRPAPQLWLVIDKLRQDLPGGGSHAGANSAACALYSEASFWQSRWPDGAQWCCRTWGCPCEFGCGCWLAVFKWKYSWPDVPLRCLRRSQTPHKLRHHHLGSLRWAGRRCQW